MKPHKLHLESLEIRRPFAADLEIMVVCDELTVPDGAPESAAEFAYKSDNEAPPEVDRRAVDESFEDTGEDDGANIWYLGGPVDELMYVQRTLVNVTDDGSSEPEGKDGEPTVEDTEFVDNVSDDEIVTFGTPEILMTAGPATDPELDDVIENPVNPAPKPETSENELDESVPVFNLEPTTSETRDSPNADDDVPVIVTMSPDDIASNTTTVPSPIDTAELRPRRWLFVGRGFAQIRLSDNLPSEATTGPQPTAVDRGIRFGIDARFRNLARTQAGQGIGTGPGAGAESAGSAENGKGVGNPIVARRRRLFR